MRIPLLENVVLIFEWQLTAYNILGTKFFLQYFKNIAPSFLYPVLLLRNQSLKSFFLYRWSAISLELLHLIFFFKSDTLDIMCLGMDLPHLYLLALNEHF